MHITWYSGLYATIPTSSEELSWAEVVRRFSASTEAVDKFSIPGWGAHALRNAGDRRAARNVGRVTAFVFDVDAGTLRDLEFCVSLLTEAAQAAHFYSSHSHREYVPAYRLIIPPTRDIRPAEYLRLREHLINRYQIPCKKNQSGDVSRFWFSPSHYIGVKPSTITVEGKPFDPGDAPPPIQAVEVPKQPWSPPPEPSGAATNVGALRATLKKRATRLARQKDPRAVYLKRLLDGDALDDQGNRNNAMLSTCGMVVYALPRNTPVSAMLAVVRPSLYAMMNAGSKLNEGQVERMLLTAMEKRSQETAEFESWRQGLLEAKNQANAEIEAFRTAIMARNARFLAKCDEGA